MLNRIKYVLPTLSALALTSPAWAWENISTPGANCKVPEGGLVAGSVLWGGEMVNRSTTNLLSAYCPVVTSSGAPVVTKVKVSFFDKSTTQGNKCFMTSNFTDSTGAFHWIRSVDAATGTSEFGSMPFDRTVDVNFGALGENMQLQCTIAAMTPNGSSGIIRYEIIR